MKDGKRSTRISDSDPDAKLDRLLDSLPTWDPTPGFEHRVMAGVALPAPRWLLGVSRVTSSFGNRRRLWWLVGSFACSAAVFVAIASVLLHRNPVVVSNVTGWIVTNVGLPAWRATLGFVAGLARESMVVLAHLQITSSMLLTAGFLTLAFLSFNSWMLYRIVWQPSPSMRSK